MKEWFKARNIWGAAIQSLDDADAGCLVKALWAYTMNGDEVDLPSTLKGLFALFTATLDLDDDNEVKLSEKRATAGARGGKQKVANVAIANFATNEEANVAIATNKNKNIESEEDIEKETLLTESKEKASAERARKAERFNLFWGAYPRKEDKAKAAVYFKRINPDDELLQTMLDSIEKWKKSDQWQDKQYIPHPSTWLNGKRWEDEVPAPAAKTTPIRAAPTKTVVAQQYEQRAYTGIDAKLMSEQDREMEEWLRSGGMNE